jgi:hypothetical protein
MDPNGAEGGGEKSSSSGTLVVSSQLQVQISPPDDNDNATSTKVTRDMLLSLRTRKIKLVMKKYF